MDIDFVIDGGAYCTLSPVVLSRGTIHAAGPYFCPNVRVRSRAVATNAPPHGAFRGFGAPQSIFALERHMDRVAAPRGLDAGGVSPAQLHPARADHRDRPGHREKSRHGRRCSIARSRDVGLPRQARALRRAESPARVIRKGIGFATFMHGAGFTGSGEKYLASVVGVEATADGRVRVLRGQHRDRPGHQHHLLADRRRRARDRLRRRSRSRSPTPRRCPNSGPTVASRTCMVVGKLVESAAIGLQADARQAGLLPASIRPPSSRGVRGVHREARRAASVRAIQAPPNVDWDDDKYQGDAYGAYAWAVYVAEVSVDTDDLRDARRRFRRGAGSRQGDSTRCWPRDRSRAASRRRIGYALYENVVWKDGRMANGQMTNYIMPTAVDVPPIRVFFEEMPYAYGPGGAKGIGELPMDGPAPAILNAIENARRACAVERDSAHARGADAGDGEVARV